MSTRVAATVCATVMLSYLAALGVATPFWVIVPTAAVFSYIVLACGDVLLRAFRATDVTVAASWALGLFATALALSAFVLSLRCTAAAAFCGWAILVLGLDFATRRHELRGAISRTQDAIGFLFCCAFTAAWCKEVAAAPKLLQQTGQFQPWLEYFMHAGVISEFGDERAIGRGMIWLADTPLILYHYASYAVAAAFALPLNEPGLPIATSVWLPLGFLTASAAVYTLGTCFAGAVGGSRAPGPLQLWSAQWVLQLSLDHSGDSGVILRARKCTACCRLPAAVEYRADSSSAGGQCVTCGSNVTGPYASICVAGTGLDGVRGISWPRSQAP
jgi:hypothetical protein